MGSLRFLFERLDNDKSRSEPTGVNIRKSNTLSLMQMNFAQGRV